MSSNPKGITPRGDAALSQAIDTGQPVATTAGQAEELQRFKVGDRVKWKTIDDHYGTIRRVLSWEYATVAWDGKAEAIEHTGNLVLTHAQPTPPATTGAGEWKIEQCGEMQMYTVSRGEWGTLSYVAYTLTGGCALPHAFAIAARLNAADAMEAENKRLRAALEAMLARDQKNTCEHSETHRGGMIWTICDACGQRWADDVAPFKPFEEPPEWTQAYAALRGGA